MSNVYIRLTRPEGYEEVHHDLVLEDAHIDPAFQPEVVPSVEPTEAQIEELREALRRGIELGARFLAYPRSESARHDFDVALDMMRAALAKESA